MSEHPQPGGSLQTGGADLLGRLSEFDYLDLGCSRGGSLTNGWRKFLGRKGLGIDLDENKVAAARQAGHAVLRANALEFDPAPHRFDFVTAEHLLEHLPSREHIAALLARLPRLAKHFAYLATPSFEGEEYLAGLGLRQTWMNWVGHPTHLRIRDYASMLGELGLTEFEVQCVGVVCHSSHPSLIPLSAPPDQIEYDGARHGPKPLVYLQDIVLQEVQVLVRMPGADPSVWSTARRNFLRSVNEHTLPRHLSELEQEARARVGTPLYALDPREHTPEAAHHCRDISRFTVAGGAFLIEASGADSQFQLYETRLARGLPAPLWAELELRTSTDGARATLYWDCGEGYQQALSQSWPLLSDGTWHAYSIRLGADRPVLNVRCDLLDRPGIIELRRLQLCAP